jgi:hypothetical protein
VVVVVLEGEAATQEVVAVAAVAPAERRTSEGDPRTSEAGPRASEAEGCHSQAELACHRSVRTSLRDPAG